jgi:hypothetical protein
MADEPARPVEQEQPPSPDEIAEAALDESAGQAVDEEALSPEQVEELRAEEVAFSWQASEYVHHHKGPGWYLALTAGLVVLLGVAVWLQFWLTLGAFAAMGVAIFMYAHKPPRTLLYELTATGITIDGRAFPYKEFRSFGVLPDAEWHAIDLEPAKRFNPRITVLFDTEDLDAIVSHLELHLPQIDRKPDIIDRLSRYLRF